MKTTLQPIHNNETFLDYHTHLIKSGLLTVSQLSIVKQEQQINNQPLRSVILKMGFLNEKDLIEWSAQEFSYEKYSLPHDLTSAQSILLSDEKDQFYQIKAVPLSFDNKKKELTVALADVLDVTIQDTLKRLYPKALSLKIMVAREQDIITSLDELYDHITPYGLSHPSNTTYVANDTENNTVITTDIIDKIFENAIKNHASDIHFSPEDLFIRVYFRIDGLLNEHRLFHKNQWLPILSRLKILSGMNIAETRLPQFGRFSQNIAGRNIDIRSSAHPTANGENFVLRVLDRIHTFMELPELGFSKEHVTQIKRQLNQPHGVIIITGPTGSGKTTTLYSMLSYLRSHERNIMTLEDPIEYKMHNIRQTQINSDIGFDFPDGIRSILRQDPDVILVGEIRDENTAKMALRAAMTGHLVLTTLHTNSALLAVNRLSDLGVNPNLLSGNLNCVISQRLVKKPISKTRGYQIGRRPIAEILNISPELDSLFTKCTPYHELLKTAKKEGYKTMQQQASELIESKELNLEDVQNVLAYTDPLSK